MRKGGLALVTVMILGALARMIAPQSQQATPESQPVAVPASTAKETAKTSEDKTKALPGQWYTFVLAEKIRDFFGQEHAPDQFGQEPPWGLQS
jgi:hypothetical protein